MSRFAAGLRPRRSARLSGPSEPRWTSRSEQTRAPSRSSCVRRSPGPDGSAGPILPDIIGEAAILRAFKTYDDRGTAAVRRAFEQAGQPAAATTDPHRAGLHSGRLQQPLAWLDTLMERGSVDVEQLMLIADTLPESSFALMEHAARLTQKVAALLRDAVAAGEPQRLPALAAALNNLAIRLSEVGRRQAALGPAEEAADPARAGGQPRCLWARSRFGPQHPGHVPERGGPAPGGARARPGGRGPVPRAGAQGARCLSARSRFCPQQPGS